MLRECRRLWGPSDVSLGSREGVEQVLHEDKEGALVEGA
jgi:hypothetical protein